MFLALFVFARLFEGFCLIARKFAVILWSSR